MYGTIIQFMLLLAAHAVVGIYSSTLKYSKRFTCTIWGFWVAMQTLLLLYAEFVLTDTALQFFFGFVLSLAGQYFIFFATTKGGIAHRIFIMLTYSNFFCIAITFFMLVNGSFRDLHWTLSSLIQALLLAVIVTYFLRYVCSLCHAAAKNITTGWISLIFVNIVFIITIILSSFLPDRLSDFSDPAAITFIFLSITIMAV